MVAVFLQICVGLNYITKKTKDLALQVICNLGYEHIKDKTQKTKMNKIVQ